MAGLYVHIPYCHSKCFYCDFFSSPNLKDESFIIECIIKEFHQRKKETETFSTIYLGGGTPSILSDDNLKNLLMELPIDGVSEATIEVNPEDVTLQKAKFWHSLGFNRISMGVQSFVDSELSTIGRRHNSADAEQAIEIIRKAGFDNFSIDLIYGLPGQTPESWAYSLSRLFSISPRHFSAYLLSYEPRTRLTAMLNTGKIKAVSEEDAVNMYDILIKGASANGYDHYEVSNFSKTGFRAVHNSNYWNGIPYIGLGPSAHSYDGKVRRINPSNIKDYISKIEKDGNAYDIEEESKTDIFNDMMITALRTSYGLAFASIPRRRLCKFLCDAFPYLQTGKLIVQDGHIIIPERYWMIGDSIMRDLIQ